MDLHMPYVGGIETTRRIRLLEYENGWAPVPIIGLTASMVEDGRPTIQGYDECRAAGMEYLGMKPISRVNIRFYLEAFVYSQSKGKTSRS